MKKFIVSWLAFLLIGYPFGANASDWSTDYQNVQRNTVISSSDNPSLELKSVKSASLSSFEMPVYSDGVFYFSERGQLGGFNITAVDKVSGATRWAFSRVTGTLGTSPIVEGDYILIPASTLICLNKKTGDIVWESSNPYSSWYFRYPMVAAGYIYLWDANSYGLGSVLKYDLTTGQQITSFKLNFNSQTLQPLTLIGGDIAVTYSSSNNNSHVTRYGSGGELRWDYLQGSNASGPVSISGNIGFLSVITGDVGLINLETGVLIKKIVHGGNATVPVIENDRVRYLTTSQFVNATGGDTFIYSYDLSTGSDDQVKKFDNFQVSGNTRLLKIGNFLYFGNNKGEIVKYSIENGLSERFMIAPGVNLRYLMYADGFFVAADSSKKKLYFTADINYSVTANSTITIDSPYKCTDCNQYLGQLHDHYIADVNWPGYGESGYYPAYTVNKYKSISYDFIAMTEHNLMELMPVTSGILQLQNAEESTQGWGKHHLLAIGINQPVDPLVSDQDRINEIINQGGIPIFAHPDSWVYGADTKKISELFQLNHMEIYNYAVDESRIPDAYADDTFDKVISSYRKYKYYLTAGDDYTPGPGKPDGGAVIVNAHSNDQSEVMAALKNGDFYAVQGSKAPRLHISSNGSIVSVASDEVSEFKFIGNGGKVLLTSNDVMSASYEVKGDENYVRVEVKSSVTGKKSWTQPFRVNVPESAIVQAGNRIINLKNAIVVTNSSENVNVMTLDSKDYPGVFPSAGYMSPVYSLNTSGVLTGTNSLSISYRGKSIPVNEDNLSIFYFNDVTYKWERVPSTIDKEGKTVTTILPHYSMYTLSADLPEDTEAPVINNISPLELTNIAADTEVGVQVSDNEAVTSVIFGIDGNYLATDSDPSDGWNADLKISELVSGAHKLNVIAKDFSGNKAEKNFDFSIISTNTAPLITMISPAADAILNNQSAATGSYVSSLPVESISIYVDNIFIDNADIDTENKSYSKTINWDEIKIGDHVLKTVLTDIYGNRAVAEVTIKVGEEVKAKIISPEAREYLRSEKIPVNIEITPTNAEGVEITLDGVLVNNNSEIDLINLSFGKHLIEVKKDGKVLDYREFSVTTNYDNVSDIIWRLFSDGHIANFGITTAITTQFSIAEAFYNLGKDLLEQKTLDHIEGFVDNLSELKKPLVDYFGSTVIDQIIDFLS